MYDRPSVIRAVVMKTLLNFILIASVILMHFVIARPYGYPLTIMPFVIIIFMLLHFKNDAWSHRTLLLWLGLIFWPFFILLSYTALGGVTDFVDFIRTYLLWLFSVSIILACARSRIKRVVSYSRGLLIAFGVVGAVATAQIIGAEWFGLNFIYTLFRKHAYVAYEYDEASLLGNIYERAHGFYLEPSFCAFVVFSLLSALMLTKQPGRGKLCLLVLGMLSMWIIGSASGILMMIVLTTLGVVSLLKTHVARRLLLVMGGLLSIPVAIASLGGRLAEISIEGSSGYWRLIAPLTILKNVFVNYPLGVPFGQIESFLAPMGLQHGRGVGTSIDNGMYCLAFYFGWCAVFFISWLVFRLANAVLHDHFVDAVYWWYIIGALQFSGGIFVPEFVYPVLLVTYLYRVRALPLVEGFPIVQPRRV